MGSRGTRWAKVFISFSDDSATHRHRVLAPAEVSEKLELMHG